MCLTDESDCATAPFIDPDSLQPPPFPPFVPDRLAQSVEWRPETHIAPVPPAHEQPPILHEALQSSVPVNPEFLRSPETPPAPSALAGSVEWQARTHIAPARPIDRPYAGFDSVIETGWRTGSVAATAVAEPATTALALAPEVDRPPEEIVARTLALLDRYNPSPLPVWSTLVRVSAQTDLTPDHRSILGMESDLLHLLEALRQSPNCALLDGGLEEGPLPAKIEPRWLARPQDLEYIPTPRRLAPSVAWRPAVPAADLPPLVESLPATSWEWPARDVNQPRTVASCEQAIALSPRAERLFRLWIRPERKPPATGRAHAVAPVKGRASDVRLPAELRGFHENGILGRPPVVHHVNRTGAPGWLLTTFAAVVVMLSLWILGTSSLADRFNFTHAEAAAPSDAAQSAFPTMSKYVEVTGVRASVDTKNSEIRYVVVNHSAAELPPFVIAAKLRAKRGGPVLCSFSAKCRGWDRTNRVK